MKIVTFLSIGIFMLSNLLCEAQDIDMSFNENFYANYGLHKRYDTIGNYAQAYALAVQLDGKILMAGPRFVENQQVMVVRTLANGEIDSTFNFDGIFSCKLMSSLYKSYLVTCMYSQLDGKVVVGGNSYCNASCNQYTSFIIRLNANGDLDNSFNATGILIDSSSNAIVDLRTLVCQPDGKIIIAGNTIRRFNMDGTIDLSFGIGGNAIIGSIKDNLSTTSLFLNQDGTVFSLGSFGNYYESLVNYKIPFDKTSEDYYENLSILKLKDNGQLDSTFGIDGHKILNINNTSITSKNITIQNDGKILISASQDYKMILLRLFQGDGQLDNSFGSNGKIEFNFDYNKPYNNKYFLCAGVAVDTVSNKIFMAGTVDEQLFGLIRIGESGDIESKMTFFSRPLEPDPFTTTYYNSFAYALAIESDGNVIIAGSYKDRYNDPSGVGLYTIVELQMALSRVEPDFVDYLETLLSVKKSNANVNTILVYPNPATAFIEINATDKIDKIELFNSFGVLVYSNKPLSSSSKVNVDSYSTGLYSVVLHTEKGRSVEKVIIE